MKRKKVFGYNPFWLLAIIVLSASVYKAQIKPHSDELTMTNPNEAEYVSGLLVESSKDILVSKIYVGDLNGGVREFLNSLSTRVLIFLNDQWIHVVDSKGNEDQVAYNDETGEFHVTYIDEVSIESFLLETFYAVLGAILYDSVIGDTEKQRINHSYVLEGELFEESFLDDRDYFSHCVYLFFSQNERLNHYPNSFNMVNQILYDTGLI